MQTAIARLATTVVRSKLHLLLFALSIGILALHANAQSKAKPRETPTVKLIEEYFAEKTEEERRDEIMDILMARPRKEMVSPIKKGLEGEGTRNHAFDLATILVVPGLWEAGKKYYPNSYYRSDVAELGLATRDASAQKFLFERWEAADADSEEFEDIQPKFCEFFVPLEYIERFATIAKNAELPVAKRRHAAGVVAFQIGSNSVDLDEIVGQVPPFAKLYKDYSKPLKVKGFDIVAEYELFLLGKGRPCGTNWWIDRESNLGLIYVPQSWQSGNFDFTVHLRVLSQSGTFSIDFGGGSGGWIVEGNAKVGKWQIETDRGVVLEAPLTHDDWNRVKFIVKDESGPKEKYRRSVVIEVNGKKLLDGADMSGELDELSIDTTDAVVLLGGIEASKK